MADAIISFAVEQLGGFVTKKLAVPGEVRSNAEWLRSELVFMKSFLQDAEKKKVVNGHVNIWVSDIESIARDTVSVLEDFEFNMGDDRDTSCLDRVRFYTCICTKDANVFDIGKQLESLKARVEEISRRRVTYGIRTDGGESSSLAVKEMRRSTSYMDGIFVGLKDVKSSLLGDLLKDNPHRCVISIYGEGGSGKTSLARSLYDSDELLLSFPHRAWTYVSQEYNIPEVLRRVIKSLKKKCSNEEIMVLDKMNEEDLERYLWRLLEDIKYLVVIDDVWDVKVWESLKRAFPDDGNHSRVIVTTRNKDVATRMDERIYAHQIRLLNPKESWKLFLEKLSQGDEKASWCSPAMQEVGREMVDKFDGLPLAIVVLAGLLAHKKSLEEWQTMREHVWSQLINGSMEISQLLNLSYDDLSSELKLCFLYLGVYPEDYPFTANSVMRYWMAEGFVKKRDKEEEMEDIAQSYLNELINRNFIQVAGMYMGEIFSCKVHDLVRNIAMRKAIEVNMFEFYRDDVTHPPLHLLVRRQVIHAGIQRYVATDHYNYTSLRSLIIFNPDMERIEYAKLVAIVRKNIRLSIVDIEVAETPQKLLKAIGSLKQLKFLGLLTSSTTTIYLPPSIGNLTQLQMIVIDGGLCIVPEKMSKLKKLRHLHCPRGVEGNTAEIGTLSNLRYLGSISYGSWSVIQTHDLINLRELRIDAIEMEAGKDYSLESISRLKSLRSLVLVCEDKDTGFPPMDFMASLHKLHKLFLCGKLNMLPSFEEWPMSISLLVLENSELDEEDPIPILGRLPNLVHLDLIHTHEAGTILFPPQSFPQLEQLGLCRFSGLEMLELEEGALPIIKSLYIIKCEELTDDNVPDKLKSVLIHGPGETDTIYAACDNLSEDEAVDDVPDDEACDDVSDNEACDDVFEDE